MTEPVVQVERSDQGVATVTLNRPKVGNAYNRVMLEALRDGLSNLTRDDDLRLLVLRGNGRHFQAGVDLAFQSVLAGASAGENDDVFRLLTGLMRDLNAFPVPTLALVQGACIGGGTGFVASCDMVIATENAIFSVAEVRWGTHAAPIFPQLLAAMGIRHLRRYATTAERFGAERAREIGFVHEVCHEGGLDEAAAAVIDSILANGPQAVRRTKELIFRLSGHAIDDLMAEKLALEHSVTRRTDEAREGFTSFREKRPAAWQPKSASRAEK